MVRDHALQQSVEVGAEFGPVFVKVKFEMTKADSGLAAALGFLAEHEFSWDKGKSKTGGADDDSAAANMVQHCVMKSVYEGLRTPLADNDDIVAIKERWVTDAEHFKKVFSDLAVKFPMLAHCVDVMSAFSTVCAAARQPDALSPRTVSDAKTLIKDDPTAIQLRDSLNFAGVGMMLSSVSDSIVVKGALDDELDSEFRLLGVALHCEGMPKALDDNSLVVSQKICAVDKQSSKSTIMGLVVQSTETLIGVVEKSSSKRIAEEDEALASMLGHIADCTASFDAARTTNAFSAWGKHVVACEEYTKGVEIGDWPPTAVHINAPPFSHESESCMRDVPKLAKELK